MGALDAPVLAGTMARYAEILRAHREELDSLNVFPVPDGDTGTNLVMTQEAVAAAVANGGGGIGEVAATISRAALMGARGNSGVILSQVLRGLCEELAGEPGGDGAALAAALRRAADEAWRAVAEPVEGTMLTVLRDAAGAAERAASAGATVESVAEAALEAAKASLDRTPELLPDLARAGVVDAGAKGVVLLFDALRAAVAGVEPTVEVGPLGPVGRTAGQTEIPETSFGHEVMYLLECADDEVPAVRDRLASLGDSLVVVGGGGLYTVHVHTDDPARAVAEGESVGTARDVRVASLDQQVADRCLAGEARAVRVPERAERQACATVAVAPGRGIGKLFRSLGADVVEGGPGALPSVEELVTAIERAPSDSVLLLPNHRNVQPAAEQAARAASGRVEVVPTRSVPAGIAAAAAFSPEASLEQNAADANRARADVVAVEIARAVRDADTPAGRVSAGQALGVVDGDVWAVHDDAVRVALEVLRPLVSDGHEILTLFVGDGVSEEEERRAAEALAEAFPHLEIEAHRGDQPHYPFLIGLE